MKHLIKNNEIMQSGIPSTFTRENGEGFWGGYETRTDIHYLDGWRDELIPPYDPIIQRLGKAFYDTTLDMVTWPVKARNDLPMFEEAKIKRIKEVKRTAKDLLSETDFYAIRKAETGKAIPPEVIAERQSIRAKSDALELAINALLTVKDILTFEIVF